MTVAAEIVVSEILKADAGVAALVSERVETSVPRAPRWPLVVVEREGGAGDFVDHLDGPLMRVEAYASDHETAHDLAAAALHAILYAGGVHGDVVVTGAAPVTGIGRLDDPATGKARYLFRIRVFAHAVPVSA